MVTLSRDRRADGAPNRRVGRSQGPFIRFLLVGGANTAFSFLIFRIVLVSLGRRPGAPAVAQACAYLVGILTGYVAHSRLTFQHQGAIVSQLPRFVAINAALLGGSFVSTDQLVTRGHLPINAAWAATTVVATIASFLLQRSLVFST